MIQTIPQTEMLTPLGYGHARYLWELGGDLLWGVAQKQTGEIWWWPNHLVRACESISEGRPKLSPIKLSKELSAALTIHRKRYGGFNAR